jgi:hypothetical protein
MNVSKKEAQIGKVGEFLVCADLTMKGFSVSINDNRVRYDLIADTGSRLLRIQVKTCQHATVIKNTRQGKRCYKYNPRYHGKQGLRQVYAENDLDVFALVALDIRQIAYLASKDVKNSIYLYTEENRGEFYNDKIDSCINKVLSLKGCMSKEKIAKKFEISKETVRRIQQGTLKKRQRPLLFTDCIRDTDWFLQII